MIISPISKIYEVLGITNKKDLQKVSKELSISSETLKGYAKNMSIPAGKDAKKIQDFLGISELEYQIKFGSFSGEIKDAIANHAKEIASLIAKDMEHSREPKRQFKPIFESSKGQLFQADSLNLMKSMADDSVDLIFADPPFNLGKKYESRIDDQLSNETYLKWTESWVQEAVRILKPGGSVFIWSLPKWNTYISEILNRHLTFRHWIAVNMKYGFPIKNKLYPAHYALVYYVKGNKPNSFHPDRLPMDVCRACGHELKDYGGYKNKMNPRGITLSDVWNDIYPVRHEKYKKRQSNELSLKLLDRIISMATNPGDVVFDPFGGSGTTYVVAEMLNRKWIGSEIGPVIKIIERLKNIRKEEPQLELIHSEKNKLFLPKTVALRKKNGFWLP